MVNFHACLKKKKKKKTEKKKIDSGIFDLLFSKMKKKNQI